MVLTKKALNIGLNYPIEIRRKEYKRYRKPKHANPFSIYLSYVCCYGNLKDKHENEERLN